MRPERNLERNTVKTSRLQTEIIINRLLSSALMVLLSAKKKAEFLKLAERSNLVKREQISSNGKDYPDAQNLGLKDSHQYFQKVIIQSGSPVFTRSTEQAIRCTNELMNKLGCKNVADLQKVDVDNLISTAASLLGLRVWAECDRNLLPLNQAIREPDKGRR